VNTNVIEDPNSADTAALRAKVTSLEELLAARECAVAESSRQLSVALEEAQHEHRRLRYSEERLNAILEAALDAVFCFDASGVVGEWNPQAELILGWSREQAVGQTIEGLRLTLPRSNAPSRRTTGESEWAGGLLLDQRVEAMATHMDGWDFPVELGVARVGHGADAVFSVFLRDITVRKENQEDLADARDGALTASRLKSEFLAAMSHEIRTPMNGVVGMSELLLSTGLTPEQRNYAEAIQGSAEGLLTVLSDILDFSSIEIGQLSLKSIPFDLRQVVEETADLLAPKATQKNIELTVRYATDAPAGFLGDAGRLRQILTNLIGNAVKFTQVGHVLVIVKCEQVTGNSAEMSIAVEDTGIGIPAEKLEHIFEKFSRTDSSTTRNHQGLGLAIAKRLAEMMGGSLRAESQPGGGSRFSLRIELERDAKAAAAAEPAEDLAGLRVLVIDNSDASRSLVCDQLAARGVVASTAAIGQQALTSLRAASLAGAPFDVAFVDYHLPDTEGEALAVEIKADPSLAATALIALTSVAGQRYASRMLLFGFAAIVVKPLRPTQLFRALARARGGVTGGAPRVAGRAAAAAFPAPGAPAARTCRARVLVAEDSTVNQKVVTRMLEKLNCAVDLAADGKQAAAMAETVRYDVIFMDCHMPEMDGFEATAVIRGRSPETRTPIIALTASAMEGDRERCLKAGMDDHLAKPIKVSDLADALQRWAPAPAGRTR
jgi:PAS domain S-box-containing protein